MAQANCSLRLSFPGHPVTSSAWNVLAPGSLLGSITAVVPQSYSLTSVEICIRKQTQCKHAAVVSRYGSLLSVNAIVQLCSSRLNRQAAFCLKKRALVDLQYVATICQIIISQAIMNTKHAILRQVCFIIHVYLT